MVTDKLTTEGSALRWRRWLVQLAAVGAVAALFYLALAWFTDAADLAEAWRVFPLSRLPAILGLVLLGLSLRALRWQYYSDFLDLEIPWRANLIAFLASFALTATPGKVGEVVKSLLLRRRFGTPVSRTAGMLVAERATDLLAVAALAIGGLWRPQSWRWAFAGAIVALLAALAVLASRRLHRPLVRALGRLPGLRRVSGLLLELLESSRDLLQIRPLTVGLSLAVCAWSCEAFALFQILAGVKSAVSLLDAGFVFGTSTLLGVASMLPGGLGGFEATMLLLLQQLGLESAAALAATLLIRLTTLWFVSLLGALFLVVWLLLERRRGASNLGDAVNPRR